MNLKVKFKGAELEIQNVDKESGEQIMLAFFEYLEGGSFVKNYERIKQQQILEDTEKKVKYKSTYSPVINGVRETNGVKLYKCHYNCSCGKRGYRYIKEDAEETNCHQCNQELRVEPATANDLHDEEFNYFVAY